MKQIKDVCLISAYLCECSRVYESQSWHPLTPWDQQAIKSNDVVRSRVQHAHEHLAKTHTVHRVILKFWHI